MNRLYRSQKDRIIGGVCGGLADYLGIDPLIVRILMVLVAMANGLGIVAYLVMWVLIPTIDKTGLNHQDVVRHNVEEIAHRAKDLSQGVSEIGSHQEWSSPWASGKRMLIIGGGLVAIGLLMLLDNFGLLWWFSLGNLWPLIPIAIGAAILLNGLKDKH